jgi:hypothetical protein
MRDRFTRISSLILYSFIFIIVEGVSLFYLGELVKSFVGIRFPGPGGVLLYFGLTPGIWGLIKFLGLGFYYYEIGFPSISVSMVVAYNSFVNLMYYESLLIFLGAVLTFFYAWSMSKYLKRRIAISGFPYYMTPIFLLLAGIDTYYILKTLRHMGLLYHVYYTSLTLDLYVIALVVICSSLFTPYFYLRFILKRFHSKNTSF